MNVRTPNSVAIDASRTPISPISRDAGWSWWPHLLVRGAGFPADGIQRLRAPQISRSADALASSGAASSPDLEQFREEFSESAAELATTLQDIAASPRFQQAVAWQNPRAIETGIEPLLRWRPTMDTRNNQHRGHEQLVASYWQRYCVKNESIGFFGPVAWAKLNLGREATSFRPGGRFLESSDVFFESWAIDALADVIDSDPQLRPWLSPRTVPYLKIGHHEVVLPTGAVTEVPPLVVSALRLADGRNTAWQIALALIGESGGTLSLEEAYELLTDLCMRRWLVWKIEVPVSARPERALRKILERIGEPALRDRALARLEGLEDARSRVAQSASDVGALRSSLLDLQEKFVELTGAAPHRHEGLMYAGRSLVYLDCRRDVSVEVGRDILRALEPIDLVLQSARWLTWRTREVMLPVLRDVYERLSSTNHRVDLGRYWFECMRLLHVDAPDLVGGLQDDFDRRWQEILNCPLDHPRVSYRADEIREDVLRAFDSPRSGWNGARYCSPDVLLTAPEPGIADAFGIVLGELHIALNTLRYTCFVAQHPDPSELMDQLDRDFPTSRLFPVLPKEAPPRLTTRIHPALIRDRDVHVALFHQTVDPESAYVLRSGDATVVERDREIFVSTPTGDMFDILDVFAEILMGLVLNCFRIFSDEPHNPRVNFDRMVVARETWRFDVEMLEFAVAPDEASQFLATRRWRYEQSLPEQVFVKLPNEQKPFFVDFESPILVSIFSKAVRRARANAPNAEPARVKVVEMLPKPGDSWLTDSEGNRYTSELRLVAFDTKR